MPLVRGLRLAEQHEPLRLRRRSFDFRQKDGSRPTSTDSLHIGRTNETEDQCGAGHPANDGLTSRIVGSTQYALPRHHDPFIVDHHFIAICRHPMRGATAIGCGATRRAIGGFEAAEPSGKRRVGMIRGGRCGNRCPRNICDYNEGLLR
jgi:hypothetical protein